MPAISVKVNDTILRRVLTSLPGVGMRIARACAFNGLNYAKSVVPVDTGFLRSTLGVEESGKIVKIVALAGYASYVEFGLHNKNYPAQPYLTPAVEQIPWLKIARAEIRKSGL